MLRIFISITALLVLVISGCASASNAKPLLTTPTPKCKDNICVQEAVVLADEQTISVAFLITDQAGRVDLDNPPQLKGDFITGSLYQIEADGIGQKIFGITQSGNEYNGTVTNQFFLFKGRVVDYCGLWTSQAAAPKKIHSGDVVRVSVDEFNFEQVVSAREPAMLGDPNATAPNIAEAFMAKEMFGPSNISVTTFPQDQAVIRLFVIVAKAAIDTKVKIAWTAVDVGDAAPANIKLGEVEQPANGDGTLVFTMKVPSSGTWPAGKYKADIYLNDKFDRTLEFNIE